MRKLLEEVYGSAKADELVAGIEKLIAKYDHQDRSVNLTHEDVLLITYGDQLTSPGKSKLATLHGFLKQWVGEHISMVHILPFYPYSSDDGFSVVDYYRVNPDLGDWKDIHSFSKDFKLMFDGVINHISQESSWLTAYLNDEPAFQDYFIRMEDFEDVSRVTRPRTSPLGHGFTKSNGSEVNLWTTFSKDQVDINFAAPAVFLNILDLLLYYVSNGASAIRLDAIGFMWKESGTTCIHLPQAHQLIQVMRSVLNRNDHQTLLITETNVPHRENISYFGDGRNEAHMVYNFTLPPLLAHSLLTESTDKLSHWARSLEMPSDEVCFFNFLSSHDGVGVRPVEGILTPQEIQRIADSSVANGGRISYKSNPDGTQSPYEINCNYFSLLHGTEPDVELAIERMVLAHMIMLSFPGLPAIYFHSLFGSQNDVEGMNKTGHNRTINRQKFNQTELEAELLEEGPRKRIFDGLSKLIAVRKKYPAFHPRGKYEFMSLVNGQLGIRRSYAEHEVVCLFNLSVKEEALLEPHKGMFDVINKNTFSGVLPPLTGVWLVN